jgi:IS30 family transposase
MFDSGLSARDKERVRRMHDDGYRPTAISQRLDVDPSRVDLEINAYETELANSGLYAALAAMVF